jgi:hypothetical protein
MKFAIAVLLLVGVGVVGQTMKEVEKAAKARAKSEGDRPVAVELACTSEKATTTIIRVMSQYHYRMTSESNHLILFSKAASYDELPFFMMPVGGRNVTLIKEVQFLTTAGDGKVEASADIQYVLTADRQNPQVTNMNGNWRWRYELESLVSAVKEAARNSCQTMTRDTPQ